MPNMIAYGKEIVSGGRSGSGTTTSWNQIQTTGTKIAEIGIDGVKTSIYAPSGGGTGGGHIIENDGTPLTQRDTLEFKDGIIAEDDSANEKTVVFIDEMPADDMDDIFDELPSGGNMSVAGYVPLGTIISFYGETAPKFFLACDGAAYNKVDYPELANHLLSLTNNTPYIVDGDDTKFKVPDLRGEFVRGAGTNSHTSQGSGADVGVHQDATTIPRLASTKTGQVYIANYKTDTDTSIGYSDKEVTIGTASGKWGNTTFNSSVAGATGGTHVTTRPTNTSVLFCIAYKDIYSNPMNDYSTAEKIVGTWIDGKPIYQKTISGTLASSVNVESTIGTITNLSELVFAFGKIIRTTTRHDIISSPFVALYNNGTNIIAYNTNNGLTSKTVYITVQYTKTTD